LENNLSRGVYGIDITYSSGIVVKDDIFVENGLYVFMSPDNIVENNMCTRYILFERFTLLHFMVK